MGKCVRLFGVLCVQYKLHLRSEKFTGKLHNLQKQTPTFRCKSKFSNLNLFKLCQSPPCEETLNFTLEMTRTKNMFMKRTSTMDFGEFTEFINGP
jgi:hypothetical protein